MPDAIVYRRDRPEADDAPLVFPLDLRFKLLALAGKVYVRDNTGQLLFFVKQKAFKLREAVTVFADEEETKPLFQIEADRVLDFSAQYRFTDASGKVLGKLQRKGMRSIWRARYDIVRDGQVVMQIQETNPWTKLADGFLSAIPIAGVLSGYLFHPAYDINRASDAEGRELLFCVKKRAAFWEGRYSVEKLGEPRPGERNLALLSSIMMLLLERSRG